MTVAWYRVIGTLRPAISCVLLRDKEICLASIHGSMLTHIKFIRSLEPGFTALIVVVLLLDMHTDRGSRLD